MAFNVLVKVVTQNHRKESKQTETDLTVLALYFHFPLHFFDPEQSQPVTQCHYLSPVKFKDSPGPDCRFGPQCISIVTEEIRYNKIGPFVGSVF